MESPCGSPVRRPVIYFVASIIFFSSEVFGCQDDPVGIANRNIIPDDKFTATSWYGGSNEPRDARLNGADYGWAPRTPSDPNDYLQIDLGQGYVICAIATQGCNGCSERTTQYKISTSVDKNTGVWATYKNGVIDKLFPGNTDSNTVVKNVLAVPVLVRYIRFIPTAYHSWKTMRVEAYGFMKDLQWTSPAPTVDNITSTSATVRWRKTTGSPLQANITFYIIKYQGNSTTRTLNVSGFETSVNITGLTPYTNYSVWIKAVDIAGHGSWSRSTNFTTLFEARCQDDPVGIANRNIIPDDKFTATSWYGGSNEPRDARLNGADYGWAPRTPSDPNDYLQIDLGQGYVICAIATQGCNGCSERTTQYKISTSVDKNTGVWATYKNGVIDKLFPGNTDSNTVVKNVLAVPVLVRYIRFIPTAYHSWKTMRVEAYGFMKDLQWTSPAPTVHNITSTSATVRWRKTTGSQLQANITFYIIKYQDNSTTRTLNVSGFETSVNITGLTPYTNYSVWIKAVDIAGHGSWSCSINFTTLVEAHYPSILAAPTVHDIKSASVIVRWIQPAPMSSQASVTTYVLQYQNNTHALIISVSPPATSHVITGLAIYTNYSVQIKAISGIGPGQWSLTTNFRTLSDIPVGFPNYLTSVARTSQSILVNWQAPKSGINGPFLGYKVFCISGSDRHESTATPQQTSHTFSGLKKWTLYNVTVVIRNDKGDGPISNYVLRRTLEDAPGQPQSFQVAVLNSTGVQLDWTLPRETNGIIRGFKLRYKKTDQSSEKDLPGNMTLSYVLTVLDKCTLYSFKMLAYTIKDGPFTAGFQEITAEDAPSAPLNLEAKIIQPNAPSVPQVTLTWSKPAVCGDNVRHYKVSYGHDLDPTSKVETVDKSQLTVMIPVWGGVTYAFRARGVTNKEGPDTPTKTVVIPIYAPRVSPSNLTLGEANKTTIKVSWDEIPRSKSNGPVIAYEVNQTLVRRRQKARRSIDAAVKVKLMNSSCCCLHLYDVLVCAEYHISIKGYTSVGAGPSSDVKSLETSVPGPPVDLMVQTTKKREVSLTWQKPKYVTEAIESYTISFEGKKDYNSSFVHSDSLSVSSTKIEVLNLYPGTRYTFRVSATTACGKGDYSLSSSSNTKVDAPPAPVVGFVSNTTSEVNNITVWGSSDINGQIRAYQIIVVQVDKTSSIDEMKLKSYEEAEKEKLHYYIAAEMRTNQGNTFPRIFILGDDKEYNGYRNIKIKDGKTYHVLQRALTQNEKMEYLAGQSTLIAKGKISNKKDSFSGQHTPTTDTTCADLSDSVAVSLAFNAVFLLFIVLLLVYIKKLRNELEETKKALTENRPATASTQTVYKNTNTIEAEEGLSMASLPAHAGSTYEQIDLHGVVGPSDVQTKVTGPQTIPADKSVGYYEPIKKPINELKNRPKPKPKPKSKQQIYETVQPKSLAPNPKQLQNTTGSSSQSTYQSLTQENRQKPVYQSLHTYGNTKINNDGSKPRTQYFNQSQA